MKENSLKLESLKSLKNFKINKNNLFTPTSSNIISIDLNRLNEENNIFLNLNSPNNSSKTNNTKTQFPEELINKEKKNWYDENEIDKNDLFITNKFKNSPIKIKKKYHIGFKLNNYLYKKIYCKCKNFNKNSNKNICEICNKKIYLKKLKEYKCSCIIKEYKGICCKNKIDELKKINSNFNKNNVVQNIFFKNEKYYYSNKINFKEILRKIYYQNFKLEDLKEYILPSFKKIKTPQEFFESLFIEAKIFGDFVRNLLVDEIKKLDLNNNYDYDKVNPKKIIKIINFWYKYYKNLENINFEIEKLTKIYWENFLENKKQFSFDTFLFHRKMFVNRVYNELVIYNFIKFVNNYLKINSFNQNHYKEYLNKINEIYETLEQISNEFSKNLSNDEKIVNILDKNKEINYDLKNENNQTNKIKKKKNKNKKKKKKYIIKNENINKDSNNDKTNIKFIEDEKDDNDYIKLLNLISKDNNSINWLKKVKVYLNKKDIIFLKNRIIN